ncbi:MAG: hypothetical protein ACPGUC_01410 [Gammaproteobacteria bacterium]
MSLGALGRGWGLNAALGVVVLLLSALAWLSLNRTGVKAPGEPLARLSVDAVSHVEIRRRDDAPIVLSGAGLDWLMQAPYAERAHGHRVRHLAGILTTPVYSRFPVPEGDLAEFGLDRPLGELQLNDVLIVFGGLEPITGRRYVRLGKEIATIGDERTGQILGGPEALVDNALLPTGAGLTQLRLPGRTLRRAPAGWLADPPMGAAEINALLEAWRHAKAIWVSVAEGDEPASERYIELTFEDGVSRRYDIEQEGSDLILLRRDVGLRYQLPGQQTDPLIR